MSKAGRNIIVIGASAGGLEALDQLIAQLPTDLPAAIFIVQHMAPENTAEALLKRMGRNKAFHCALARDGETFKSGRIYIARPDYHLLIKKKTLLVTKGARENRYRPAIDPLFRSAAVSHGARVVGVILTGMLDDGTAGLVAIKKCGGVTVVQDPKDAAYPDMPTNALNRLKVDHCVSIADMARLLEKLTHESPGRSGPPPPDVRIEAEIAERVLSDIAQVDTLGSQVPYNCPNCGGVLWEMASPHRNAEHQQRFRCHTGHSFTAAALLTSQTEKIEESLWVSLRMLEERRNLLNSMAGKEARAGGRRAYFERAEETTVHIERIRTMLLARGKAS